MTTSGARYGSPIRRDHQNHFIDVSLMIEKDLIKKLQEITISKTLVTDGKDITKLINELAVLQKKRILQDGINIFKHGHLKSFDGSNKKRFRCEGQRDSSCQCTLDIRFAKRTKDKVSYWECLPSSIFEHGRECLQSCNHMTPSVVASYPGILGVIQTGDTSKKSAKTVQSIVSRELNVHVKPSGAYTLHKLAQNAIRLNIDKSYQLLPGIFILHIYIYIYIPLSLCLILMLLFQLYSVMVRSFKAI